MGIYLPNMEMPTTCGSCWFCHTVSNEKWHCRLTGKSFASYSVGWGNENNAGENGQHPYIRRDDCPLIEVPEPHGRLIDADALDIYQRAEAAYAEYQEDEDNLYLEGMANGLCEAAKQLSTARTVIHVSKEG